MANDSGNSITPRTAIVRFSYTAAHDDELDLAVDDVIEVMEEAETGWRKGKSKITGRIGLFPTNFVEFNDNKSNIGDGNKGNHSFIKNSDNSLSGGDFSPEVAQRTSVVEIVKGRNNRKLEMENEHGECFLKARVLFTYLPTHDDELELKKIGQLITIISKSTEDPGWLLASIDGKKGLIPDNFVEIMRPTTFMNNSMSKDSRRIQIPPSVPTKPAKPAALSIATNATRRATTSAAFAAMHSTLADALTKTPKTFGTKIARGDESVSDDRSEERLSHLTTSRPKQPNKRPPSTLISKTKSMDDVEQSDLLVEASHVPSSIVIHSPNAVPTPLSIATPPKPIKAELSPASKLQISPTMKSDCSTSETVPRSEYIKIVKELEELREEMSAFRTEVSQRLSSLEAKIATSGL